MGGAAGTTPGSRIRALIRIMPGIVPVQPILTRNAPCERWRRLRESTPPNEDEGILENREDRAEEVEAQEERHHAERENQKRERGHRELGHRVGDADRLIGTDGDRR